MAEETNGYEIRGTHWVADGDMDGASGFDKRLVFVARTENPNDVFHFFDGTDGTNIAGLGGLEDIQMYKDGRELQREELERDCRAYVKKRDAGKD